MLDRDIIISLLLILGVLQLNAQNAFSTFSMDDCTFTDELNVIDASIIGTSCGCGVKANALSFEGVFDQAVFDADLNEIFKSDWSMSLYLRVLNQGTDAVDILFLGEKCGIDSLLSLRYLPGSQRFRFLLSSSPAIGVQLDGLADGNSCWQHVVITKNRSNVFFYINGVLVDQDAATSDIVLNVNAQMTISNSPCLAATNNPDVKFIGQIDEINFFDHPLSERDVGSLNLQPDKILTMDTTIFSGQSVRINTGGSCFQDFEWSPEDFLDNPNSLDPISTPDQDITYTLTVNGDDGCTSVDQVTIRVADPSVLTCADLVLPSAFTPNNDNVNDEYGISNFFLIDRLSSFEIFNKWGGRVFFTNLSDQMWDGNYQGKPAPPDSYVYKVVYMCDNQLYTKSGVVSLLR